jgi:hypothetical protein
VKHINHSLQVSCPGRDKYQEFSSFKAVKPHKRITPETSLGTITNLHVPAA